MTNGETNSGGVRFLCAFVVTKKRTTTDRHRTVVARPAPIPETRRDAHRTKLSGADPSSHFRGRSEWSGALGEAVDVRILFLSLACDGWVGEEGRKILVRLRSARVPEVNYKNRRKPPKRFDTII